ncbi:MAG: hypothetical protein H7147_05390, partial [Frankiaceae bacterium]|nr:hypothetical protein [Arenimonas sp.]
MLKAAAANGSENGNVNAAFGQETAAQAKTLKDADLETRKAFGGTVAERAKLQGQGDDGDDEGDTTTESAGSTSKLSQKASTKAKGSASASAGTDHANANAEFGQTTASSAKTLKDADVDTRKTFGTTVNASAQTQHKP